MTILAITSQKGGVGKTTVSVNLAYSMARRGWNTLLIDTDPQGSVGLSLSEKARKCQGFYDAVNTGTSAVPFILPTR
ncbi:MAG TPA: ParA family protein, partial [Verrucomicrobiales bacterium]|nr:ParA family protein [Verrucomicrobiales bacterium]